MSSLSVNEHGWKLNAYLNRDGSLGYASEGGSATVEYILEGGSATAPEKNMKTGIKDRDRQEIRYGDEVEFTYTPSPVADSEVYRGQVVAQPCIKWKGGMIPLDNYGEHVQIVPPSPFK